MRRVGGEVLNPWVWTLWIYFVVAVVSYLVMLGLRSSWPELRERNVLLLAATWPLGALYFAWLALVDVVLGRERP